MCGRFEIVDGKRIFVRFGVANAVPEMLANLCTILLPESAAYGPQDALKLHDRLYDEYKIQIPAMAPDGKLCVRFSANAYNEASEYDALLAALQEILSD